MGERIVHELNGISCLPLEAVAPQRKGIAVPRSFGRAVVTLSEMEQAVAAYATRAAEKLRHHGVAAVQGFVFMHANAHDGDPLEPHGAAGGVPRGHRRHGRARRRRDAGRAARLAAGFPLRQGGARADGTRAVATVQRSFLAEADRKRRRRPNDALDAVNARFGRGTLVPVAAGVKRPWSTKCEMRSPAFTTRWEEMPIMVA